MPKDSTTWLSTSAFVGSVPTASTTSAGAIVTRRRSAIGIVRAMKPCMTTWPASVPTLDDARPDASSASANASAAPGPTRSPKPACASSIDSTPVMPCVWNSEAATMSIAMFATPARPIAIVTSTRW
jgi:hypothetical protein